MALLKGSKHAVAVHRMAELPYGARFSRSRLREALIGGVALTSSLLDYSNARAEQLDAPTTRLQQAMAGVVVPRAQERVRRSTAAALAPVRARAAVQPRPIPIVRVGTGRRMRQIMVERIATARADQLRNLRSLTRYLGVSGMVFRCAERKARREVLFARAELLRQEGRGSGRPRPRKAHWRRSYYSLIGC